MSEARVRIGVTIEVGVRVGRAEAVHGVLAFVADVLRLPSLRKLVDKGVRENPWLTGLRVAGLDGDGRIAEELVFGIDWERHRLHLSQGRGLIDVPNGRSLVAGVSPDLLTALRLFKESCLRRELDVAYYVGHVDIPGRDAGAELGLGRAVALRYAGEPLATGVRTSELDEVSAAYNRYGPS